MREYKGEQTVSMTTKHRERTVLQPVKSLGIL